MAKMPIAIPLGFQLSQLDEPAFVSIQLLDPLVPSSTINIANLEAQLIFFLRFRSGELTRGSLEDKRTVIASRGSCCRKLARPGRFGGLCTRG